jgi:hypothetical protein
MTQQFKIGQTYSERSLCDHECIHSFTILARTAKTVSIEAHGEVIRRKVTPDDAGVEHFLPFGSYSMCTVVGADDPDLRNEDQRKWG